MIIIEILRYLFGYIEFRAFGGFPDRFVNLCTKEGIPLWNIKNAGGRITACTTIKGYLAVRRPARKSGMRCMALRKRGLIFFLKRNKKRVGLLAGAAVSVALIFILSQFVWSVSVVGNTTLEDEYILSEFEKYGIKVGARISSVDLKEAAQTAVTENEKLSWAAVNRKGSVLVIEVREITVQPQMYDNSKPTNVVASEDGLILSLDILHGTAEIQPGSAVTAGDLLISGVIRHRDGSESVVHADGHVKALVKKKETFSAEDFSFYKLSYENKRKIIFFFGIKIPLGKSVPETNFSEHKSFLESGEMQLPIGIITQYGAVYSEEKTNPELSFQDKAALLGGAMYAKKLLDYSEIKTSSVTEKTDEFGKHYEFYAECEQEIGRLQEIYVEKTNDIA